MKTDGTSQDACARVGRQPGDHRPRRYQVRLAPERRHRQMAEGGGRCTVGRRAEGTATEARRAAGARGREAMSAGRAPVHSQR